MEIYLKNTVKTRQNVWLQNPRDYNEKSITPFHETTRVTALSFPDLFLVLYAVFNSTVFLLYAHDKRKAKAGVWRTPETLLLLVAAIGPFGAYGAMILFRHKTLKMKFYLVPVFLIIHIVAIIWLLPEFS